MLPQNNFVEQLSSQQSIDDNNNKVIMIKQDNLTINLEGICLSSVSSVLNSVQSGEESPVGETGTKRRKRKII